MQCFQTVIVSPILSFTARKTPVVSILHLCLSLSLLLSLPDGQFSDDELEILKKDLLAHQVKVEEFQAAIKDHKQPSEFELLTVRMSFSLQNRGKGKTIFAIKSMKICCAKWFSLPQKHSLRTVHAEQPTPPSPKY